MKVVGIIPARYASSRFPGKPLADLLGKPMVWYVYEQASKALEDVYIATDDQRIFDTLSGLGAKVVMTASYHRSGTERCAEAVMNITGLTGSYYDFVLNIQGDEPLIPPELIELLVTHLDYKDEIVTLIRPENNADNLFDPNVVKVVKARNNNAIYFSRQPIPFLRDVPVEQWTEKFGFFTHIGIYAYRTDILQQIVKLEPTPLETAEKLEQLRWIENGFTIKTLTVNYSSIGVDTPEDLKRVEEILKSRLNS